MTVPLHILCAQSRDRLHMWGKFLDCMEQRAEEKAYNSDMITEAKQELALYGAHTDWTNDADPIWFPDEESLMSFVLSYS